MNWTIWIILVTFGSIFLLFLMSCLGVAKQADEKIERY